MTYFQQHKITGARVQLKKLNLPDDYGSSAAPSQKPSTGWCLMHNCGLS